MEEFYDMRECTTVSLDPMYGKPFSEAQKELIFKYFRKDVFIYDADTLKLIHRFSSYTD